MVYSDTTDTLVLMDVQGITERIRNLEERIVTLEKQYERERDLLLDVELKVRGLK